MSKEHYEFDIIWDLVIESPDKAKMIRIRFGEGETGWAYRLPGDRAVIMNTPLEERLAFMDVVVCDSEDGRGRKQAGEVVWRAYACKTGVLYDPPTQERFGAIKEAFLKHRLIMEGWMAGRGCVDHHEGTDLAAILAEAGLSEGVELQAMSVEPEPEADRVYH